MRKTKEKNEQQEPLGSTPNSSMLKHLQELSSFVQLLHFLICEMQLHPHAPVLQTRQLYL